MRQIKQYPERVVILTTQEQKQKLISIAANRQEKSGKTTSPGDLVRGFIDKLKSSSV